VRRFLLLVNRWSRGGDVVHQLQRLLQQPPLCQHDTTTAVFSDDGGIHRGLEALTDDMIPVAVGGDGTVASVVRVLRAAGFERPLGILPLGTGNGLCHSIGIGRLEEAAAALVDGQPRLLDLLTTTHPQSPIALLSISVGLESLVMSDFAAWRRRSRLLAALVGSMRCARRRCSGVSIYADGEQVLAPCEPFCNAGLYNMPCYGFDVCPRPVADPGDGLVDFRLHLGRMRYLGYLGAGALQRSSPLGCTPPWQRVRQCRMCSPLPLQIDGETRAPATFEIQVEPGALQVLTPAA
jgi:diacylglycerol kinase family enzyme